MKAFGISRCECEFTRVLVGKLVDEYGVVGQEVRDDELPPRVDPVPLHQAGRKTEDVTLETFPVEEKTTVVKKFVRMQ